jgi:hypothetical protein
MDPDKHVPPLAPPAPPPSAQGGGAPSHPPPLAAGAGAATRPPVVLWVLPLRGFPAPVGYIYDATPDAEGGLLAAALAFFSHHGHQVFHDPCLDLDEYCWAMSVLLPIIPVDRLQDHILLSGLELIKALFTPSPTNSFGTAFMAAYLESPPSPRSVPVGGLAAPPGVSGDCSVAPGGVPTGSMLSPTRGIGVNVGASLFNMGGLGVPEGMPVSNMGALDVGQILTRGSLPLLSPSMAPCFCCQI